MPAPKGFRPPGGSRKGRPNKATAAKAAAIAEQGITPLDYLLNTMRDEKADPILRFNAAKAAASYVHPGLSSVEVGNKDGKAFKVFNLDAGDIDL
jgi:hypothetical protein